MPPKRKSGRPRDSESSSADEGGSFDVYHSAAITFQNGGKYAKAIANYTKVRSMEVYKSVAFYLDFLRNSFFFWD